MMMLQRGYINFCFLYSPVSFHAAARRCQHCALVGAEPWGRDKRACRPRTKSAKLAANPAERGGATESRPSLWNHYNHHHRPLPPHMVQHAACRCTFPPAHFLCVHPACSLAVSDMFINPPLVLVVGLPSIQCLASLNTWLTPFLPHM